MTATTPVRLRPRWRKMLADLWGNKARTLLVVASIAVGVFAIGVIIGTYVMLNRDLTMSYEGSNPANITVTTTPFGDDLVEAVRRVDGVARAEGIREMTVRLRTGTRGGLEEWDSLKLIAHPDYDEIQIHRRFVMQGEAVPDDRELILEHKTLAELGLTVGDRVEIELPDGTRRSLPIVGTAMDQSDPYGTVLGGLRGYVTLETLPWLHQPRAMNKLFVTATEAINDKDHLRRLSATVTDKLEESGYVAGQTEVAGSSEHPFGNILEALLWVLIIVGVFIALLSSSLIANTTSALLTQHLRQIGVMKLVGARRFQVIGLYLLLIGTFGVLALIVAIPLGSVGAYQLSRFAADIINFRLQPFRPIPGAIAIQVALGLLLPPLAALMPVLKGSEVTVSSALSSSGLGDEEGHKGLIVRLLRNVSIPRTLLISLRNTFRRKKRLLLTLFTLTLGGAVFIGVFRAQTALDETVEATARYFGADIALDFAQPYRSQEVIRELSTLPGVSDVEVWTMTGGELVLKDRPVNEPISLIAPPAESRLIEPRLIEGRWLLPGDENAIAINEAVWGALPDLRVGDTVRLDLAGHEDNWIVVGIFQYTGMTDLVAYANHTYVADLLNQPYHAANYRIATKGHSLLYQEQMRAEITAHFSELGYNIHKVDAGKTLTTTIPRLLGIVIVILLVLAIMTALVGAIGLTGTMGINVMERTREIGVMRAIGAHNAAIFKLVVVEGLIIGLISYGIGAVLAFPIGNLLSDVINEAIFGTPAQPGFAAHGFIIWLAVVVPLSILASFIPARNATRLTIREVLAYE